MKQYLFMVLFVFCATHVSAQDVIVKKDGSTILSKVLEVNTSDIKYKRFSNQNGPTYTINKFEIMCINYENGETDEFKDNSSSHKPSDENKSSQRHIKKPADLRNKELISLYNRIYEPRKLSEKKSAAKEAMLIFGIKPSSVMSNEDIEMSFIRDCPNGYPIYYINLKNKTDRTLYIDKGNCFRLLHDGTFFCYYDNTEQTTVNLGGTSGASIGLGSVAGVLGVGGTAGQLAGGVSVGGGSSHSVSTTYSQQRIIAIPPHGNRNLTNEKWVQTKKTNLLTLSSAEYQRIESAEEFRIHTWEKGNSNIGLKRGIINKGNVRIFKENELNWKREYIITYSTEEDFSTYSSINAELFIHEIIGNSIWRTDPDKHITGINEYTIQGNCWLNK